MTSTAEKSPEETDYFSFGDDQMKLLPSDKLTELLGRSEGIINELTKKGQNTERYRIFSERVKSILKDRKVHILE